MLFSIALSLVMVSQSRLEEEEEKEKAFCKETAAVAFTFHGKTSISVYTACLTADQPAGCWKGQKELNFPPFHQNRVFRSAASGVTHGNRLGPTNSVSILQQQQQPKLAVGSSGDSLNEGAAAAASRHCT
jgi:hypothetical protein